MTNYSQRYWEFSCERCFDVRTSQATRGWCLFSSVWYHRYPEWLPCVGALPGPSHSASFRLSLVSLTDDYTGDMEADWGPVSAAELPQSITANTPKPRYYRSHAPSPPHYTSACSPILCNSVPLLHICISHVVLDLLTFHSCARWFLGWFEAFLKAHWQAMFGAWAHTR